MATVVSIELPTGWAALNDWGPKFDNTRLRNSGGWSLNNANWDYALWGGTVSFQRSYYETATGLNFEDIYNFFVNRNAAYGFLVTDPLDKTHSAPNGGASGVVESISGTYRLTKHYADTSGGLYYTRLITRPTSPVVVSGTGGTPVVSYTTGAVTGISAPGTWTGSFKIPMEFAGDGLTMRVNPEGIVEAFDVHLLEVREA